MALEGVLEEFGLTDILQLLYFQKKTGTLNVTSSTDVVKLSLIDGNIIKIESKKQLAESRLGKILIKKGLITQDNLNVAIDIQKEENVKLGIVFLRRGLVSQEILTETIKAQITEAIAQIFSWTEGSYEFIPENVSQDSELPISIDTQHLLMDGLRTVDEWTLIEGRLDLSTVYKLIMEAEPVKLDETEKEILNLIDGQNDVSTLISVSPSGDFDTSRALISLEEKGVIAPVTFEDIEEERKPAIELAERPVIIATIFVAVLVLALTLKGHFDAFTALGKSMDLSTIESIKRKVDVYEISNGVYPDNLSKITKDADAWDRPYVYRLKDGGFILFSNGQDGIEGTDDDVY
jgi:hypothetical protein